MTTVAVSRTRRQAAEDWRRNLVAASASAGATTSVASASCQSISTRMTAIPSRVITLVMKVTSPSVTRSLMASMSLVMRATTLPVRSRS